ncbi:MAG: LD-carboxypeptidase [Desulfatitalea sp.]|nr:LD-carboxypeptidase [Desulfatitalea sp.]NNK02803.1 LD-carboxypeptidase [Desulfatitalea sp.]
MRINKPQAVKPGDTLGIVAPAGTFDAQKLHEGIAFLNAQGYQTRLADGVFEAQGYLAGNDMARVEQLHAMFSDPDVDAVLCARGGYGSLRLLPLLDFTLIAAHPKPFVGFSDICALLLSFYFRAHMPTFHGPMVCSLGQEADQAGKDLLMKIRTRRPLEIMAEDAITLQSGVAEGIFLGGNLTTICHLLGTPYAPLLKGCILFLEDTGEALYRIDRMLTQMHQAACFEGLAGVVLGGFSECGPLDDIYALVGSIFPAKSIPILAGVAAGHGEQNVTLPMGVHARLDADRGTLIFLEAAVDEP